MVRGAISDDHMIQLKVVTGTLNSQKLQDEIPESGVRPPLDWLDGQNMVLRNDIARPHCTRIIEECKNQQNIANLPRPSSSRNTKINNTSLVFHGRACCWT